MTFVSEVVQGDAHKVHRANGMVKSGVQSSRVDQIGQTKLFDPP